MTTSDQPSNWRLIQDVIGLALLLVLAVGIWQAVVRIEKKQDAAKQEHRSDFEQLQQLVKERMYERANQQDDAGRGNEANY